MPATHRAFELYSCKSYNLASVDYVKDAFPTAIKASAPETAGLEASLPARYGAFMPADILSGGCVELFEYRYFCLQNCKAVSVDHLWSQRYLLMAFSMKLSWTHKGDALP